MTHQEKPKGGPNKKALWAAAVFVVPGLLMAMIQPLKAVGDSVKPGLGDLMNGVTSLMLFGLAPVVAHVVRKLTDAD